MSPFNVTMVPCGKHACFQRFFRGTFWKNKKKNEPSRVTSKDSLKMLVNISPQGNFKNFTCPTVYVYQGVYRVVSYLLRFAVLLHSVFTLELHIWILIWYNNYPVYGEILKSWTDNHQGVINDQFFIDFSKIKNQL